MGMRAIFTHCDTGRALLPGIYSTIPVLSVAPCVAESGLILCVYTSARVLELCCCASPVTQRPQCMCCQFVPARLGYKVQARVSGGQPSGWLHCPWTVLHSLAL